jgi:RNA recognition motif-containing protein
LKIYVGNLAFGTSEDDLQKAFAPFGAVESVAIVKDKYSGESRGFGFVEMPDSAAAAAIDALNGTELGGRNLTVNESRPRTDDRAGGSYNRGRR